MNVLAEILRGKYKFETSFFGFGNKSKKILPPLVKICIHLSNVSYSGFCLQVYFYEGKSMVVQPNHS